MQIRVLFLLFIMISMLHATKGLTIRETKTLTEKSLQLIVKQKAIEAFNVLKPFWNEEESEIDNVSKVTKGQMLGLNAKYGKIIGFTLVSTKNLSDTLMQYMYIVKYKTLALRFEYVFYKAEDKWVMYSLYWDDKVRNLFR